jgi:hypothetical protein
MRATPVRRRLSTSTWSVNPCRASRSVHRRDHDHGRPAGSPGNGSQFRCCGIAQNKEMTCQCHWVGPESLDTTGRLAGQRGGCSDRYFLCLSILCTASSRTGRGTIPEVSVALRRTPGLSRNSKQPCRHAAQVIHETLRRRRPHPTRSHRLGCCRTWVYDRAVDPIGPYYRLETASGSAYTISGPPGTLPGSWHVHGPGACPVAVRSRSRFLGAGIILVPGHRFHLRSLLRYPILRPIHPLSPETLGDLRC